MKMSDVFLLIVGSFIAAPFALAEEQCPPANGVRMAASAQTPWTIQVRLSPKKVPLNAPFDAIVTICSQSKHPPTRLTLDATMPAHKHGMNYEPKTRQIGQHRYQVENLLFHMPGTWRLEVTAYENDKPHRFTLDVNPQ